MKKTKGLERAERKDLEWNHMMQEIIKHDPNAITVLDKNLYHLFVSDRFLKDYQMESQDIIHRHHYEVFPDIPEKWKKAHQKALKGEVVQSKENKYIRENGSVQYTSWECRPWHRIDGEIGGIVLYTEVVTEWVVAREKIRERELFLQSILDTIQDGICVMDSDQKLIRVNETIKRWYKDDLPLEGKRCHDVYRGSNDICDGCSVKQAMKSRKLEMTEVSRTLRTGEIKVMEQYAYPMIDDKGQVIAVVQYIRDITRQKESEAMLKKTNEQLQLAKEAAEAVNEAKSQFLANMNHELRTPINGLMGMLQLLKMTEISEEQAEYLELSMNACQSLTKVIQDILNYAKLKQKKEDLIEEVFSPKTVLGEVMELYLISANHKGLFMEMEIDESVPQKLKGDGYKLKRILNNLLGNAVKFTERGKIQLSVLAEESFQESQIKTIWRISDTGIGIPKERIEVIFDGFKQGDNSHTRPYGGVGLGLSTAQELAELMGGRVFAESVPEEGSIFILECEMKVEER